MIRAVFDTNVYLSALLFKGKPGKIFLKAVQGKIILFASKQILAELRGVLKKKFHYSPLELEKVERLILEISQIIDPQKTIRIIPSELMDNHVLACGLEAKVDFIVSGDKKHLLSLKKFKNIPIISPAEFLKTLKPLPR